MTGGEHRLAAWLAGLLIWGILAATAVAAPLPEVLSRADAERYRDAFDLQKRGEWRAADRLIAALDDDLLRGHLLAQRYLHPTHYRSEYAELRDWMAAYADLPQAGRIHRLAARRRPASARWPNRPDPVPGLRGVDTPRHPSTRPLPTRGGLSEAQRKRARAIERIVTNRLRHGWTKSAKRMLNTAEARQVLSRSRFDALRAALGMAYLGDGRVEWALDWADKATRSGDRVPRAHWVAGLAAWKLGRFDRAAGHFERAAASRFATPEDAAAAAFWAARAHLVSRRPARVNAFLDQAAAHPRTFYGLIALGLLGREAPFARHGDAATERRFRRLAERPAGRRLRALAQVGQTDRAARELELMVARGDRATRHAALLLADRAGLAEAAMRLARRLYGPAAPIAFAFPLPGLRPKDGFTIDRALLFALMRQESRFDAAARSPMGARGLLQIMPRTASFVAGDHRLHGSERRRLHDPDVNLRLGQAYLRHLLGEPPVDGDLLRLLTAWNGGPGNLAKWLRLHRPNRDPLLFMELIPLRETRHFVEAVLANMWIYRFRLGQPAPSLAAIAAGEWPAYSALDGETNSVASHVAD